MDVGWNMLELLLLGLVASLKDLSTNTFVPKRTEVEDATDMTALNDDDADAAVVTAADRGVFNLYCWFCCNELSCDDTERYGVNDD